MASLANDPNGRRRILFVAENGQRKAIRLGKITQRAAESILSRVEQLIASAFSGYAIDADTARWVAGLNPKLADKLARVGLIAKRQNSVTAKLGEFLAEYLATRTDIKPSTRRHLEQARAKLIEFLGPEKQLAAVTPGDADEFRLHLMGQVGDNTSRRMCGRAKQFFRAALRRRLISENPFGDMKGCGVQPNRSRDYFVTREEARRVLDACPDAEWRLLFALSRYGGLRCPSENLALRWSDVDWERGRLRVPSPKTEHHPGRGSRIIPIFPELRSYLEAAFDQAEPGTEFVIARYRSANANLRTQLERIITRAGLVPWPKLFQNLRSTRETELAESFPLHVACAWLGNTQTVAARHYLQVTDEHFQQASMAPGDEEAHKSGAARARGQSQQAVCRCARAKRNPGKSGYCDTARRVAKCQGAPTWTRTKNLLIKSQLLYQLSYRGLVVRTQVFASFCLSRRAPLYNRTDNQYPKIVQKLQAAGYHPATLTATSFFLWRLSRWQSLQSPSTLSNPRSRIPDSR